MRRALPALGLLLAALGGCNREPAFDERFADVSARITASADAIDAAIAASESPPAPPPAPAAQ